MPKVMGIDAGFQAMGVVVVDGRKIRFADTCLTQRATKKRGVRVADDDADRCRQLARFLLDVIKGWQPVGAVIELPSGGAQGARANRAMGMATGIVVAVLEATKVPAEWVTPQAVKKAATGKQSGSKSDVQVAVRSAFDWDSSKWGPWPKTKNKAEHVADAAATILAAEGGTLLRALEMAG